MVEGIEVLILEDDPMVLELHRQYLSKMKGFLLIGSARSGEDALKLIAEKQPHLAILDIYMPGINGLEVLKRIRRQGWNTDVILITAAHDSESVQQGIQFGAADYIIKPFTFIRFKKALDSYRRYYTKLRNGEGDVSQSDIDSIRQQVREQPDIKTLPKGMQQSTLNIILDLLRQKSGYFTVREVADALGISRVTVQRYLNYLLEGGLLKGMMSYGPIGRPLQKFQINKNLIN